MRHILCSKMYRRIMKGCRPLACTLLSESVCRDMPIAFCSLSRTLFFTCVLCLRTDAVLQEFESELKNSADDAADEGKKIADDVKSKVDDTLK